MGAWASLKAIRSDRKDDDTKWLTYWVLYGFVSFVESITDIFLYWIPMYEFAKMLMYIFLWSPQTEGAIIIYKRGIGPIMSELEGVEDVVKQGVDKVGGRMTSLASSAASKK